MEEFVIVVGGRDGALEAIQQEMLDRLHVLRQAGWTPAARAGESCKLPLITFFPDRLLFEARWFMYRPPFTGAPPG